MKFHLRRLLRVPPHFIAGVVYTQVVVHVACVVIIHVVIMYEPYPLALAVLVSAAAILGLWMMVLIVEITGAIHLPGIVVAAAFDCPSRLQFVQ